MIITYMVAIAIAIAIPITITTVCAGNGCLES